MCQVVGAGQLLERRDRPLAGFAESLGCRLVAEDAPERVVDDVENVHRRPVLVGEVERLHRNVRRAGASVGRYQDAVVHVGASTREGK